MAERPVLQPTAEHPITITPTEGRVVVRMGKDTGKQIVADTRAALTLQESTYSAVYYLPLEDVDPQALTRTGSSSYCPYKGEANYYSVTVGDVTVDDAVWTYERPYDAVAAIAGRVAFYPDKADISVGPE